MAATFVEDRLTPLAVNDLLLALHGGYVRIMGAATDRAACLAALGAQLCLESGNGRSAHWYNFGNKKKPSNWDGLFTRFRCDELFDEATAKRAQKLGPATVTLWKGGPLRRVVLVPPHPWTEFVAFDTAEAGTADYVEMLACRQNYRAAWSLAFAGDPAGFSRELGRAHYYTAEIETYTKGLVSISKRILPSCERIVAGDHPAIEEGDIALLDAVVWQTARDSLGRVFLETPRMPDV